MPTSLRQKTKRETYKEITEVGQRLSSVLINSGRINQLHCVHLEKELVYTAQVGSTVPKTDPDTQPQKVFPREGEGSEAAEYTNTTCFHQKTIYSSLLWGRFRLKIQLLSTPGKKKQILLQRVWHILGKKHTKLELNNNPTSGSNSEPHLGYPFWAYAQNHSTEHFDSILSILSEHLFQELNCLWPMCALIPDSTGEQCHVLNIAHAHLVFLSLGQVLIGGRMV